MAARRSGGARARRRRRSRRWWPPPRWRPHGIDPATSRARSWRVCAASGGSAHTSPHSARRTWAAPARRGVVRARRARAAGRRGGRRRGRPGVGARVRGGGARPRGAGVGAGGGDQGGRLGDAPRPGDGVVGSASLSRRRFGKRRSERRRGKKTPRRRRWTRSRACACAWRRPGRWHWSCPHAAPRATARRAPFSRSSARARRHGVARDARVDGVRAAAARRRRRRRRRRAGSSPPRRGTSSRRSTSTSRRARPGDELGRIPKRAGARGDAGGGARGARRVSRRRPPSAWRRRTPRGRFSRGRSAWRWRRRATSPPPAGARTARGAVGEAFSERESGAVREAEAERARVAVPPRAVVHRARRGQQAEDRVVPGARRAEKQAGLQRVLRLDRDPDPDRGGVMSRRRVPQGLGIGSGGVVGSLVGSLRITTCIPIGSNAERVKKVTGCGGCAADFMIILRNWRGSTWRFLMVFGFREY